MLYRGNAKPAGGEINHQFLNQRCLARVFESRHANNFLLHGEALSICSARNKSSGVFTLKKGSWGSTGHSTFCADAL